MIQETVPVVVDSLGNAIGAQTGAQVGALVTVALGFVTKLLVDLAKKGLTALAAAPDAVKSIVAILFAEGVVWVNHTLGLALSTDISALETTVVGLVVGLASMGWHAVARALGISKPSEEVLATRLTK
jgi:hypothetical protein